MNISTAEISIAPSTPYLASGRKQNFNLTQLGNAERFAAQYGTGIKYCHAWKQWLVWDGRRWCRDENEQVHRLAVATVRSIRKEAKQESDDELRSRIEGHARRCETNYNLNAILALAQKQEGIPVQPIAFDKNPMLFNCLNGTIDLKTGVLRPHAKEDLNTKLVLVEYLSDAECPVWDQFLDRILGGDATLIDFMQRAVGYSLTGSAREKALFFFYGTGDNGKTTLLEAVRYIMGDYAGAVDIDALMKKAQTPEKERATADLLGKRFVTSSEAAEGEALHEARIKHLTGMGRLSGRRIYGSAFEFDPQFKLFIDANHKPHISGTEDAIWNRFKMIPFTVSIPKAEQDKHLLEKLAAEAPGILAWAVKGCLRWQREGLGTPDVVTRATEDYRNEMDPISDFLADCCDQSPAAETPSSDLYQAYAQWCEVYRKKPFSDKAFGMRLEYRGFAATRTSSVRGRKGLAIRRPPPVPGDTAYDA